TVARTGRLSSVDPNLQNIPIRLEEGRKVRQAFVPRKKDWKLFSADYSQIELRILAHISEDEHLIETFKNNEDVHTTTAVRVFNLDSADEVTPNMRRDAKAVNFGIVYGISDYGLSQNLGISRAEAKDYIDTYFERFPGVKEYIDRIIREAKDQGYVETILHSVIILPEINFIIYNLLLFIETNKMTTQFKCSMNEITKVPMIQIDNNLEKEKLHPRAFLKVHHLSVSEAPESKIPT